MKTLTQTDLDNIASLPFGPNGKASVKYLMQSRDLSFEDAVIELERLANAPDADALVKAQSRQGQRHTGVR